MSVPFAAIRSEMALLTNITAENHLSQETFADEKGYVSHTNFILRVTVANIADIINTEKYTFPRDSQQLRGIVPIA